MRRLFWSGAALTVAAAASVYLAAEHATHHPDSLLWQGALTAYHLGTDYNPIVLMTQTLTARVSGLIENMPSAKPDGRESACAGACTRSREAAPPTTAEPPDELEQKHIMDLIRAQMPPIRFDLDEVPCQPAAGDAGRCTCPLTWKGQGATADNGSAEECEEAPRTMPPASDDGADAPATMPYAKDEDEGANALVGFWKKLFGGEDTRGNTCCKPEPNNSGTGGAEESEIPLDRHLSNCLEDPSYSNQYPGCPSGSCSSPSTNEEGSPGVNMDQKGSHPDRKSGSLDPDTCKPSSGESATCPKKPGVDTMEFRPSDAREGEFENHPL